MAHVSKTNQSTVYFQYFAFPEVIKIIYSFIPFKIHVLTNLCSDIHSHLCNKRHENQTRTLSSLVILKHLLNITKQETHAKFGKHDSALTETKNKFIDLD